MIDDDDEIRAAKLGQLETILKSFEMRRIHFIRHERVPFRPCKAQALNLFDPVAGSNPGLQIQSRPRTRWHDDDGKS